MHYKKPEATEIDASQKQSTQIKLEISRKFSLANKEKLQEEQMNDLRKQKYMELKKDIANQLKIDIELRRSSQHDTQRNYRFAEIAKYSEAELQITISVQHIN